MGRIMLPLDSSYPAKRSTISSVWRRPAFPLLAILALLAIGTWKHTVTDVELDFDHLESLGAVCPVQPAPLHPSKKFMIPEGYRNESAHLLSKAVQIATQSFDDMGLPTEDPRWAPFYEFKDWLVEAFPLVHQVAKRELVNSLGIILTLEGTDPSLKPTMLMSHYDAVPAPESTADRWTHGMFSGFVDDEYVWGRGAADDKTLLVGQYEALTLLLETGWRPRRTLLFVHGFDEEEVFARQGVGRIAPVLLDRYGKDGVLIIIDEGAGATNAWGTEFATPANREKGYMDVKVTVGTPGGHTGIGIMAEIVRTIESRPFVPTLTTSSPHLGFLTCGAKYAKDFPKEYKKLLADPKKWDKLAAKVAETALSWKALLSTTQAVDIITGGVKVNALPEKVDMVMNFRIDFASSVKETEEHLSKSIQIVADKYDLTYSAFPSEPVKFGQRYITSELFGLALEPAPYTPEDTDVWELFAGTIKAALPTESKHDRVIAPFSSTGNSDTKVFWGLTKQIYRFAGGKQGGSSGVHTVDERASIDTHIGIVEFVHAFIQNADEFTGKE